MAQAASWPDANFLLGSLFVRWRVRAAPSPAPRCCRVFTRVLPCVHHGRVHPLAHHATRATRATRATHAAHATHARKVAPCAWTHASRPRLTPPTPHASWAHVSRPTPWTLCLTPHTPRLTPHASLLTPHASRLAPRASRSAPSCSAPLPHPLPLPLLEACVHPHNPRHPRHPRNPRNPRNPRHTTPPTPLTRERGAHDLKSLTLWSRGTAIFKCQKFGRRQKPYPGPMGTASAQILPTACRAPSQR